MKVTESNYKKVLKKIQKYTNKRRMFISERIFDGNNIFPSDVFRFIKIAIESNIDYDKDGIPVIKKRLRLYCRSIFIEAEQHHCAKDVEENSSFTLSHDIYDRYKPLIRLGIDSDEAIVIYKDSRVCFLPFRMGFIVKVDNSHLKAGKDYKLYRYKYIFLPAKKFHDIDHEISIRKAQEEADNELYMETLDDDYDDIERWEE